MIDENDNGIDSINRLLILLDRKGIKFATGFDKDLKSLVKSNIKKFASEFYKNITRINFEFNRYERLSLTRKQKKDLDGNVLRRYEYRNTSNLRIIFIVYTDEGHENIPILLCAFNEDGDKKKGKWSYNKNIEIAIERYKKLKGE